MLPAECWLIVVDVVAITILSILFSANLVVTVSGASLKLMIKPVIKLVNVRSLLKS